MTVEHSRRMIKGTIILSVWLGFIYTALQRSSEATRSVGLYSKSLFVLLTTYAVISLIVTVLVIRSPRWIAEIGRRITRWVWWPTVFIALGFALWSIGFVQPQTKIFPTIILLLSVWLLTKDEPLKPIQRSIWITIGILVVVALVAQLLVLLDIPTVHVHDEGAYSRIAFDYFRTGMLSGDIYGYPPRHFIGFGSWLVTLAYWYKIFGFGWWTGRLYSFVLSCMALPFIYAAGSRIFGNRASGVAAAGFMAVTITFVELHHVRPDAPMILLLSICLFFFSLFYQYPEQKRWYFFLGLSSVVALEVHLIALAFWAAFGAILGLRWLIELRIERRFIYPTGIFLFVLGGILPALIFFTTHLLPDWGLPSGIVLSPRGADLSSMFVKELTRWGEYIFSYPLEALLTFIAVIDLLRYRKTPLLLGLFALSVAAYIFIAPTEWPQYTRYFLPFQALCLGGLLVNQQIVKPALAAVIAAMLLGMLLSVLPLFRMTHDPRQKPIPPVVQYVADNIPPGSTVVMNMVYYLDFDRGDRYRYINPGIYPPHITALGGPTEDEVWPSLKPDIIVIDKGKDEYTPWLEHFLQSARFIKLDRFASDGIYMYVPSKSPLATVP